MFSELVDGIMESGRVIVAALSCSISFVDVTCFCLFFIVGSLSIIMSVSSSGRNVSLGCFFADVCCVVASCLFLFLILLDTGLLWRFIWCFRASSHVGDVVGDVGRMNGFSWSTWHLMGAVNFAVGLSSVADELSRAMISYGPVYLQSNACRVPVMRGCMTCLRTRSPNLYWFSLSFSFLSSRLALCFSCMSFSWLCRIRMGSRGNPPSCSSCWGQSIRISWFALRGSSYPYIMISGDMSEAVETALFRDCWICHRESFHLSLVAFAVVAERNAYLMLRICDSTFPFVWPLFGSPITCSMRFCSQKWWNSPSTSPFSLSCRTVYGMPKSEM